MDKTGKKEFRVNARNVGEKNLEIILNILREDIKSIK